MISKEVRRHPRHEKEFRVEYTVISGSTPLKVLKARTLDFSLSGARIETRQQIGIDDQLSVRIEVPDLQIFQQDEHGGKKYKSTSIMCFGRVRWVDPGKKGKPLTAGIRFERMIEPDRRYLKRLSEEEFLDTSA
jgi:hypothetical protein